MSDNNINFSEILKSHYGKITDKWEGYLPIYDKLFGEFSRENIRILEIGVQNGGSLEVYSKFFKDPLILGLDIDEKCKNLIFPKNIQIIIGNISDLNTIEKIKSKSDIFDIIIDDGSHDSIDIVTSFLRLWPLLSEGGAYVVEDLCCSYWQGWHGGLFKADSAISFFKLLIDVINCEHWGITEKPIDLMRKSLPIYDPLLQQASIDDIYSVQFFNSMCVVRKATVKLDNTLGQRIIRGTDALVAPQVVNLDGTGPIRQNQSQNPYSNLKEIYKK
jgi:hypothetical protein